MVVECCTLIAHWLLKWINPGMDESLERNMCHFIAVAVITKQGNTLSFTCQPACLPACPTPSPAPYLPLPASAFYFPRHSCRRKCLLLLQGTQHGANLDPPWPRPEQGGCLQRLCPQRPRPCPEQRARLQRLRLCWKSKHPAVGDQRWCRKRWRWLSIQEKLNIFKEPAIW